jgi:Xaa-Pro aminopeptidase|tara:strand:- start:31 stop:1317 length:1287 start_codon:yes stop_codon:yes gene_type:complete
MVSKFISKFADRKISPGLPETINLNIESQFKPRLYEDLINYDRMRMYRLKRVLEQLQKNDVGACILFDPINIRYATDSRNMSLFTMHELVRFVFISAEGKVILFDYPKSEHLSEHLCTIDEVRSVVSWDFFSANNFVDKNAKEWAKIVHDLMREHSPSNSRLAIDVSDPVGIQTLLKQFNVEIINAQKFIETARSIKCADELICMQASLETAEKGMYLMKEKLQAGMTEEELWSFMHKVNIENGGEWFETRLLVSGSRTNPWLQECSNKVIEPGELVAFDTDMVGPYGYCADISRTFVEGNRFNDEQKRLYSLSLEHIQHNEKLIKAGTSFREFAEKSWKLPDNCYDNHYPCILHGIGLCDEWPLVAYPNSDFSNADYSSSFEENMTVCVESYIGEVGGREGIKLEDQYLVTKEGLKKLSSFPYELSN